MRTIAALLLAIAPLLATATQAQDLPSRVGRIAHIEGQVSLYQDADEGWEKAYVNSPVTSENSVWTDERSRAELRISGMALRLDELTQLDIARLDEADLDAFVGRGSVVMRVRHYESNERLVFSTPNARFSIRANGRYRVDFDPQREETRFTVFTGEARVGSEERVRVAAGRSVRIFGEQSPEFVEERAQTDAFDRWTLARDERWSESRSTRYVSSDMTGYEDLDTYGDWVEEPDYGALWYPTRIASGWAPYRHGRWDYVRPWGWTWIDDAPWGYAPFHYGRWVYVRDRWAWHPGQRQAHPVWAPALVGWIGGANFNVRLNTGPSVGWYPLSPWDRYDPWFNAGPTYVNRVNIVVRTAAPRDDRQRLWRDGTRERGATVVNRDAFVGRRPVAAAALPVTLQAIRQAQAQSIAQATRPATILPTREEFRQRRREQPAQQVAAPTAPVQAGQPGKPAQGAPGRSGVERSVVRPDFNRRQATPALQPRYRAQAGHRAVQAGRPGQAVNPVGRGNVQQQPQAQERAQREAQQQQERAAKEAQQQQERAAKEAQQQQRGAQERAAKEAQQQQRGAQERAAKEAQQQQERAAKEAQQQQRGSQERAAKEAQQQQRGAQERAAKEAQQQQRQAQERAAKQPQQQQPRTQQQPQAQQPQAQQPQAKQPQAQKPPAQKPQRQEKDDDDDKGKVKR